MPKKKVFYYEKTIILLTGKHANIISEHVFSYIVQGKKKFLEK